MPRCNLTFCVEQKKRAVHDLAIDTLIGRCTGCAVLTRIAQPDNVKVGPRSLIGVGSAIRPGVTIGSDVVVGAGSAVVADIPDGSVVAGCPARRL